MDRQTMERAAAVAFLLSLLSSSVVILGYNVDIHHAVVRKGPNGGSFFGYSVAEYSNSDVNKSWMIVGAPLDNISSDILMKKDVGRPGTVYRCDVDQGGDCEAIIVDKDYIYVDTFDKNFDPIRTERDKLDNQWLGSSVAAVKQGNTTARRGGATVQTNGLIIVCAHRYVDRSVNTRQWYPVGQCSVIDKDFKVRDQKLTPCKDSRGFMSDVQGVSYCQSGVSTAISTDGLAVVIGAPGAHRWQGIVQFTQPHYSELFVESTEQYEGAGAFAYLGYSSDFAKLNWKTDPNIYYVAIGAPREDLFFGRVIIFEYNSISETIDTKLLLAGEEFGAYFGFSVAAVDLNGDNFDDLLVGAPFYSESQYERGAVYVYMNDGNAQLERYHVVLLGNVVRGRFGHAIAKAGDLNADSFDDAVISAPFTPNGGIIYIYHGSIGGIMEEPSQIIVAENFDIPKLSGFGVSLSAGMDMDGNGYPDILAGAYTSDTAILLRSRPLVNPVGTVTAKPQFLEYPKNTRVIVEVCLQYSGRRLPNSLIFDYNLTVDESRTKAGFYSRATFDGQRSAIKQNIILTLDTMTCQNVTMDLLKTISMTDTVIPIVTTLTYQLTTDGPVNSSNGDPDVRQQLYPVLRSQAIHSDSAQIYMLYTLENCSCDDADDEDNAVIPDLQITSSFVNISGVNNNAFVIGNISEIAVIVSVRNSKGNAYNARIIATFPREMTLLSPLSCDNERNDKSKVICSFENILEANETREVEIRMSVSGLTTATKSFQVELKAVSDNPENLTLGDNSWVSPVITTTGEAKFELSAGKAYQVKFNTSGLSADAKAWLEDETRSGPLVTHSFRVFNGGPSSVSESEMFILWPLFLDQDNNDSYLLYLIDIYSSELVTCDIGKYKDPLGILSVWKGDDPKNNATAGSRKRRFQRLSRSLRPDRTPQAIVAECERGTQICIHCWLQSFAKGDSAEIVVVSRLFEHTLVEQNITELNISSVAVLKIPETDNLKIIGGNLKQLIFGTQITMHKSFDFEACEESVEIPVWVIIIAVLGTGLLLTAAVVVLWRLGFFKRPKKEQLEREKRELAEHGDDVNNEGSAHEETDTQV